MKKREFVMVSLDDLRIGMFIDLELGWMAHPFPSGSFRIASQKQIEILRGLGQTTMRVDPGKSDPGVFAASAQAESPDEALDTSQPVSDSQTAASHPPDLAEPTQARKLEQQRQSLAHCERRFGDSIGQYRKTVELLRVDPKAAARECQAMVSGLVSEMMLQGESAIRLLTETAGEKSELHPVNVSVLSMLLARALDLSADEISDLGAAALLHDVGKMDLPERVRCLHDGFSAAEVTLYREHVALGVQIGQSMGLSHAAVQAIGHHHELSDGSGFPAHARSDAMSRIDRILSLVNRYDNLCNPSRSSIAMTPHEALALLFAHYKGRFDPMTISAFIRMMGVYPPGSVVQLVDERYAMVVSVNTARPLKPRVIIYEPGVPKGEALIVNLETSPKLSIRRSLKPAGLPAAALEYLAPRQRICYFFEPVAEPDSLELQS
jgi:putative nucleotidyltransferase with HDIG domain